MLTGKLLRATSGAAVVAVALTVTYVAFATTHPPGVPVGVSQSNTSGDAPEIERVRAHLYYYDAATFSEDIAENQEFRLWNVTIGGGSAAGYATDIWIVAVISGRPRSRYPGIMVHATALREGESLLDQLRPVGITNDDGRVYRSFWLYETGCKPVIVTVRLLRDGDPRPLAERQIRLDFACGE